MAGRWRISGNTCIIAYSYDGINWTASSSGSSIFTYTCYDITWTGTLWIAGGDGQGGPQPIAYSSDGITWALATSSSSVLTDCRALGSSGFLTVAGGSAAMAYSYNGIDWFASPSGSAIFTSTCLTIAYNGRIWVAGGDYNLAYSYDGINWTNSTSGSTLMGWKCNTVAWNGTRWVAGGQSASGVGSVAYSSNGINWTASTSANNFFTNDVYTVAWNGTWIASGYNGSITFIAYSTDGITWTSSGTTTSYSLIRGMVARRVLPYFGTHIGGPAGAIKLVQYGSGTSHVSTFTLAVTFTTPFPVTPNITATVSDASASWVSIGSASTTGFTAYTWNASGGVQAALNWRAIL